MKTGTVVVVVAVGAAALYFIAKQKATAAGGGFSSLGNVGGVAHSPDITTGGIASVLGSALPSLTSWFGGGAQSPSAIPTDSYSPGLGSSTISNPVYPSPAVLPYSYKQQNVDTAGMLDTNSLFTPSPVSGSSGAYSDGTNNGTDFTSVDYGLGSDGG
jgi:hypothetical protein